MKKVKIGKYTKLEEREDRDKITIPIDSALLAFQQEVESALEEVDQLTEAKGAENVALSTPESEQAEAANGHIKAATKIAQELVKKTNKTPYAFAGRQLQDIADTSLASATAALDQAATEKQPLPTLQLAGSHLQTALNNLQALRKQYGTVKAEREKALALREIKEMFVLYMEDMPLLLGGDKKSPYSRSMAEIDKEAAQAMQEMIDRKVLLYKKIAEILKDHPELQARLMSQKRDQVENIRGALLTQQQHQRKIALTTKSLEQLDNDKEKSEAVFQFIQGKQKEFDEQLALFIDRSTTWLPLGSDRDSPAIKDYLAATHALSIRAQAVSSHVKERDLEQATAALDEFYSSSLATGEKLTQLSDTAGSKTGELGRYVNNRRYEIDQLVSNQKQLSQDLLHWTDGEYGFILAAHQIFSKNKTAELQTEIELNAASIIKEYEEIAKTYRELQDLISHEIIIAQEGTLNNLGRSQFSEAIPKLAQIDDGYTNALTLLDRLVYQIIDVLDAAGDAAAKDDAPKEPKQNKKGNPGEVTEEDALAELMALVSEEQGYLKSFGIPCCRPTNVEILKDWEKQKQEKKPKKSKQQQQAEAKARKKAQQQAKAEAGKLAKQAQKAQQQANQRAREAAQAEAAKSLAELSQLKESQKTSRWNTLPSELRDELLQQRGQNPPKQYEETIQDYFRAIAEDAE